MRLSSLAVVLCLIATTAFSALDPDAVLRKEAGNFHLKNRQYEQARTQYLAALNLEPNYADAHYNLGVLYFFRLGDHSRALYHLTRYARLKPDAADLDQVRSLAGQALERIEESEREAYSSALAQGTIEALRAFVKEHPGGYYAADAGHKILLLQEHEKELRRREQAMGTAFERALERRTPEAMDAFLTTYPDAPQASEARQLLTDWTAQRSDEEREFLAAAEKGTREALQAFLDKNPRSPYAPEARSRLEKLRSVEDAYRIAAESRAIAALEVFLATYPDSARAADAERMIATLRTEEAARQEAEDAYREAAQARTVDALESFLEAYPDSERTRDAELLLEALRHEASVREREQAQQRAEQEAQAMEAAYQAAAEAGTIAALEKYLARYPDSPRTRDAERRLEELQRQDAEAKRRAEQEAETAARREAEARRVREEAAAARASADAAWEQTRAQDTPSAYQEFYSSYPGHPQAEEARRRAAAMRAVAVPQPATRHTPGPRAAPEQPAPATASELRVKAWEEARSSDSSEGYRRFLEEYPQGEEAEAARNRLAELEAVEDEDDNALSRSKRRALERYRRMLLGQ